jgi:hypothetical protein
VLFNHIGRVVSFSEHRIEQNTSRDWIFIQFRVIPCRFMSFVQIRSYEMYSTPFDPSLCVTGDSFRYVSYPSGRSNIDKTRRVTGYSCQVRSYRTISHVSTRYDVQRRAELYSITLRDYSYDYTTFVLSQYCSIS